jgi:hypothetical protein
MVDQDTRTTPAEKGIDNVSLCEINRAAEQHSVAALYYRFGFREALLLSCTWQISTNGASRCCKLLTIEVMERPYAPWSKPK